MRISELSAASGVTVPTIKYYVREGLLPPGATTTAPNQASYGPNHVRRLRLIRTLVEVGGLSIAAARAVLRTLDDDRASLDQVLGVAHAAVPLRHQAATIAPDVADARADIERFLSGLGWRTPTGSAPQHALADALLALRRLGQDVGPDVFAPYATLADRMAAREIASLPDGTNRTELVEAVVIGTVVFEAALVALRRLAEAHYSAQRFPAPT